MKLLDILFRSQIFMVPVAALWVIAGGCIAAILQQCGVDPTVYKLVGLAGLLVGIGAVVYTVAIENKENKARDAAKAEAEREQLLKS
jgi:uncharacterized membrane protein YebE (DUF533 family)